MGHCVNGEVIALLLGANVSVDEGMCVKTCLP